MAVDPGELLAWDDRTIPQRSKESEALQELLQRLRSVLDEYQLTDDDGCQCGKDWLAIGSEVAVVPRSNRAFVLGRKEDGSVVLNYWQPSGDGDGRWCCDDFTIDRIVIPVSFLTGGDRKNHV